MFDFTSDEIETLKVTIEVAAVIFLLVALFAAWFFSTLIPWKGGKDRSYITRRWACGIIWAVIWIVFFFFAIALGTNLDEGEDNNDYYDIVHMCTVGIAVLYPVLLYVLARLMPNSKLGSILHLKK
jgi:hypothetical protein